MREKSKDLIIVQHAVDTLSRSIPEWLTVEHSERRIEVFSLPTRAQIDTAINEQLIVELYSK